MLRILAIGDVVAGAGRRALAAHLPGLRQQHRVDLVIVNGENAAGGMGLTSSTAADLLQAGVDVITSGNHIWKYKELLPLLGQEPRLLRPQNYPGDAPGRGVGVFHTEGGVAVAVVNLQGRAFMDPVDCPFRAADRALEALGDQARVVVVDFHAEATSEKRALGWYLDGRVSVLFGTHTHVQTADNEVLPRGTGYITDIGMTGSHHSVIGARVGPVIQRFITQRPTSFGTAKGDERLCGALFEVDERTGRALSVERVVQRHA